MGKESGRLLQITSNVSDCKTHDKKGMFKQTLLSFKKIETPLVEYKTESEVKKE